MATQRTQIYIEGVALDLDKNVDIDFTYSIADISDFEKRTTTFSKTVVLPGTAHNSFLLGNYFDFNINNDYSNTIDNVGVNFNPLKKAFAKVTLDNVEVFVGVLRLLEITSKDGEIQYQCALFGSLGGLFSAVGEKLLTDLDLDALDHTYDITTIQNSWDTIDLVADGFVYPNANYGLGVNEALTQFDVKNFRPAISVKRVFDEIVSQAGYTYTGDFWDSNNLDKLILQNGEEKFSAFYDQLANVSFASSTGGNLSFDSSTLNGLVIDNTTGGLKRIKNNSGDTLNVKLNLSFDVTNNLAIFDYLEIQTQVRNDASITNVKSYQNTNIVYGPGTGTTNTYTYTIDFILEDGDGVNFIASAYGLIGAASGTFIITTNSSVIINVKSSTSKIPAIYNSTILGKSIVPEGVKQSEFLKNIINLFNLYIIQDPDNEFNLTFIPYPEFYDGTIIDWTDKKDLAKGFSIKPSTEFVPKSYSFKYKDDVDYYSKTYKNKYASNYGDLTYETQNEFSKDDTKAEFFFSLAPLSFSGIGLMAQLYDINTDGSYKQVKCNAKLAFWGGKKSCIAYTIRNEETTLVSGVTNYGYAGHIYNTASIGLGDLDDLAFNPPKETYFNIPIYPSVNLYYLFYKQFIDSQNNKDTKLITLYLLLNAIDIMNLSFRKYVRMDNGIYYLNKIDGYNPLGNELTKVELLRIVALEELTKYVTYTPSPIEAFLSYPRVTLDKSLPFNKSFDVQWQFVDGSEVTTNGTQTITVGANQLFGNGTPIAPGGTTGSFTFIRILEPTSDEGYIYLYGGDYSTL